MRIEMRFLYPRLSAALLIDHAAFAWSRNAFNIVICAVCRVAGRRLETLEASFITSAKELGYKDRASRRAAMLHL